jgi:hypothetical protein
MPGFLIPADLDRMISSGVAPLVWAETNLLASPGALAVKDGKQFRIKTLVPAVKRDGSCIHLIDDRCTIHAVAPFGCAFFDCGPERGNISVQGLIQVMEAWREDSIYQRIWEHLSAIGKTQLKPDILRDRMRQ